MMKEMECDGGSTDCARGVVRWNSDVGNGFAVFENGLCSSGNSGGSSQETLRTYKRRRYINKNSSQMKLLENGSVAMDTPRQLPDKQKMKASMNTVLLNFSNDVSSSSDDSHLNSSVNTVLNQLYQSAPLTEGGLLRHTNDKVSVYSCGDVDKCPSIPGGVIDRRHISDRGPLCEACNGSSSKSCRSSTDLCRQVFLDIIKSEKFARLCDLLLKNFDGAKFDSILDIRRINSRMKEGAYEKEPILFHSDMQKVWEHLQKVGSEIISLSKCLMDKSNASFSQQFSESVLCVKLEQPVACGIPNVCTCRRCGEKAEGRNCLVCDSCEEMFHLSCIEPAVEEIPISSWYCINCIANGIESPHDNCELCEKLNAIAFPNNRVYDEKLIEKSNGLSNNEIELRKGENTCNICKTELLNDKKIKVCGHSLCPHRYYHMNCLTFKQLSTYSSCWYCPSCLCRACLTDRDDHAIVLCDGCDSAYHIYCLQPPLAKIPEGKWFCVKCDVGIQKIAKAKREFKTIQSNLKKRAEDGKRVVDDEVIGKPGGVDMLLSAARTLNYEEKMNAAEIES